MRQLSRFYLKEDLHSAPLADLTIDSLDERTDGPVMIKDSEEEYDNIVLMRFDDPPGLFNYKADFWDILFGPRLEFQPIIDW